MTLLSVNLNKIALLRNSRGRDYPNVLDFAARFLRLGVRGITVHPRPDERHITRRDARELAAFLREKHNVEFNIEGYPSAAFLELVEACRPDQCTLVPDADDQLTSDHGWDCRRHRQQLSETVARLRDRGIRVSLFLDPDPAEVEYAAVTGAERVELYTEAYASAFGTTEEHSTLERYRETAVTAQAAGLGVNAGHDLDLDNLPLFLSIGGILEVSIGHALVVECLQMGMEEVVGRYHTICGQQASERR